MLIRSRLLLPINGKPISDGALIVHGQRIAAVGPWQQLRLLHPGPAVDLGESVVLPGFINAHCHLDYTGMAGMIPPPRSFPDWIKALLALKAHWSYSDYAASWLQGAKMLLASGITTVADIEAVPELLPEVWSTTPIRVLSFLEMTGVRSGRPPADILNSTIAFAESLQGHRQSLGLSPHAPYSTSPELLRLAGACSHPGPWRLMIHVAESDAEFDMYMHRRGPLFEWLKKQRDMTDCGRISPVQHLERCGMLHEKVIGVHANYLGPHDADLLAARRVSIVHCPRSHAYFKHQPFPLHTLIGAGVNVCLGTDSLVSTLKQRNQRPQLDFFAELQTVSAAFPSLDPAQILEMATLNGARALGLHGEVGELAEGASADLIAVPYNGSPSAVCDAVVQNRSPVSTVMIQGQWAIQP